MSSHKLEDTVVAANRAQEETLAKTQAGKLGLPYAYLVDYPALPDVLHLFDGQIPPEAHLLPYMRANKTVRIATDLPPAEDTVQNLIKLGTAKGLDLRLVMVSQTSFQALLTKWQKKAERGVINPNAAVSPARSEINVNSLEDYAKLTSSADTSKLLDILLLGAEQMRASDIHFEPSENEVAIRLRVDGVLHPAASLSLGQYKSLVSRMKVLSKMKLDLGSKPQDGRFGFTVPGKQIDLRMATLPTIYGEGIVLRLLEQDKRMRTLEELGFRVDLAAKVKKVMAEPYGMVLVVGPTGSGKTTTLYAMLADLNQPERKIMTLEDPVEYRIPGLIQSQIEPEEKFTFAEGLRGALRQDPDVIMVGEIRDLETAEIAVNAALTGHLLLTTLHTNSAPASMARLLNLGVAPYLLAGSVNLVLAQRLVRRLCDKCAKPAPVDPVVATILTKLFPKQPAKQMLPVPVGCPECGGTGYRGRLVVAEALLPNPQIEELVMRQATLAEFHKAALEAGMIPMETDGFWLVYQGLTTAAEVWRVTREE